MSIQRLNAAVLAAGLATLDVGAVWAQSYPAKPIRVVTSGVGGAVDVVARLIAQGMAAPLGQPVVVENRGGGVVAPEVVSKAAADGYTLLVFTSSFWVSPLLYKVPYDPVRDFSPISLLDRAPNILVVHPSVPAKSVRELIALAKARPGELNYASGVIGSGSHLSGELFKAMARINILIVNYKTGANQLADLLSGQVQMTFATPSSVVEQLKLGKLRALAVSSAKPSTLAPGLPTLANSGVPGYEAEQTHGAFAPAKTARPIINRLNEETVRFLKTADARERLTSIGIEAVGSTAEEFADYIKSDMARLSKVIREAGIKIE